MIELIEKLPWNKKIKLLRIINDWTQEEAAKMCFVERRAYQLWEKGENMPHKNNRRTIAKIFNVNEREIFDYE